MLLEESRRTLRRLPRQSVQRRPCWAGRHCSGPVPNIEIALPTLRARRTEEGRRVWIDRSSNLQRIPDFRACSRKPLLGLVKNLNVALIQRLSCGRASRRIGPQENCPQRKSKKISRRLDEGRNALDFFSKPSEKAQIDHAYTKKQTITEDHAAKVSSQRDSVVKNENQ